MKNLLLGGCLMTCILVSVFRASAEQLVRDIVEYRLQNGLRVLIQPDHSAELVAINMSISVGSGNESDDVAGVSHFIEHLLFKGTTHRTADQLNADAMRCGGYFNAYTHNCATHFELFAISSFWKEALEIHADMILNSTFPPDELEKERKVVLEEISMYNDEPSDVCERLFFEIAFWQHPYAHPVIGYEEVISKISRERILEYFYTYYVPSNMILTIVGDIKEKDVIGVVRQLYETVGSSMKNQVPQIPPVEKQPKCLFAEASMEVNRAYFRYGFRCPGLRDSSYFPLLLASIIMADGESSRLYKRLVRQLRLVPDIEVDFYPLIGNASIFVLSGDVEPTDLNVLKKELDRQFEILASKPVSLKELKKVKNKAIARWSFSKERFYDRCDEIAGFAQYDALDIYKDYEKMILTVTPEEITKAVNECLLPQKAIFTQVIPKENPSINHHNNRSNNDDNSGFKHFVLPNGLRIVLQPKPGCGIISCALAARYGSVDDPPGKAGMSNFLNNMLLNETDKLSAQKVAERFDALGVQVDSDTSRENSSFTLKATSDAFDEAFSLWSELLLDPTFSTNEVKIEKDALISELIGRKDDLYLHSNDLFFQNLLPNSPYGNPIIGYEDQVKTISSQDLANHYESYFKASGSAIAVVGDFDIESMSNSIHRIWTALPEGQQGGKTTRTLQVPRFSSKDMDIPKDKELAWLHIGCKTFGYKASQYPAMLVLVEILNNAEKPRLWSIREDHGLAYHIAARYHTYEDFGIFHIFLGCRGENLQKARQLTLGELEKLVTEPPTSKEVEDARLRLIGKLKRNLDDSRFLAITYATWETLGLGYDFWLKLLQRIDRVSANEVSAITMQQLKDVDYTIITVGNLGNNKSSTDNID